MNKAFKYILLLCNLIQITNTRAQSDRLSPDRPGFLTGTHVANDGIYLETGYQYSIDRDNDNTRYSEYPNMNIRFGLAKKLEMFVMWEGWKIAHESDRELAGNRYNQSESNIMGLGWKYGLTNQDDYNLAIIGMMDGIDIEERFNIEPSLAMAWDYSPGNSYSLFGMEQVVYEKTSKGNSSIAISGIGLDYELTSQLQVFVEYYNMLYISDQCITHGSEFGLMYFLTKNIQLDVYGGFMFHNEAVNYIGLGLSRTFTNKKIINNCICI